LNPDPEQDALSPGSSSPEKAELSRRELERRIEALEQQLEKEREARSQLEGHLQLHQAQLLELSRSIRSILRSRIWRALSTVGGGLLSVQSVGTRRLNAWRRALARGRSGTAATGPLISVLMPVFETPERWLRRSIDSVLAQSYPNWELCIADDRSTQAHVRAVLEGFLRNEPRVRVVFREVNGHIAAATNSCLELAKGHYIALLDHDDELAPDALSEVASALAKRPDADLVYTDEDKTDEQEHRFDTFFKPDWSPEYLLGCMYTGHLSVYRTALVRELGGFRSEVDGAQDYDLALRVASRTDRIVHVPKVLYHWRVIEGSMASGVGAKDYAYASAATALKQFLELEGFHGQVCQGSRYGTYRVQVEVKDNPSIEVRINVTGEAEEVVRKTVSSIRLLTAWTNFRVCLTGTGVEQDSGASSEAPPDFLVLMRAGTEITSSDWMVRLAEFCQFPAVGAVGPRVVSADGRVQSAGILFVGGRIRPAYADHAPDHPGYFLSAQITRNYLAVSGACLMTKAGAFDQAGGLDAALPHELATIDYCLRLHERGLRTVVTPYTEVRRPTEPPPEPTLEFRSRWAHYMRLDPYYNPNLPREYPYYQH
jgi:GT2 family glycosyltransferase